MRPLNVLNSGENASKKNKRVDWNEEYQKAFDLLKELCSITPVLAFADYSIPFKVHTNASGVGLGAVLYQTQGNGPDRVISYASITLSKSERKYPNKK